MVQINQKKMNKEEILEDNGWIIECESPFEIRHEDGSFATGQASNIVLDYLNQNKDEDSDLEEVLKKLKEMKPSIIQEYIDRQREINFNINNQNEEDE